MESAARIAGKLASDGQSTKVLIIFSAQAPGQLSYWPVTTEKL